MIEKSPDVRLHSESLKKGILTKKFQTISPVKSINLPVKKTTTVISKTKIESKVEKVPEKKVWVSKPVAKSPSATSNTKFTKQPKPMAPKIGTQRSANELTKSARGRK